MLKFITLLVFTSAILFFTSASNNKTDGFVANAAVTPTPIYCPPPVIELEKTSVILSCPSNTSSDSCSANELIVRVRVTAVDPENDPLNYKYTVSGGKIIGEGSLVEWDLSDVKPETYLITVVIEGDNYHITSTRTIYVKNCDDCKTN